MLEIATKERNQPGLTPDEEYTHMTLVVPARRAAAARE